MSNDAALREDLREFLFSRTRAVLATCSGSQPYTSLMAVVVTEDLAHIIFVTEHPSRKYSNMRENNEVALLFDDRSENEEGDIARARAVTALGKAAVAREGEKERLLNRYLSVHPYLASFAGSPSAVLFKVAVETYIVVSRFQDVAEVRAPFVP